MSERPDLEAIIRNKRPKYPPEYLAYMAMAHTLRCYEAELAQLREQQTLPLEKWAVENGWLRPERAVRLREQLARVEAERGEWRQAYLQRDGDAVAAQQLRAERDTLRAAADGLVEALRGILDVTTGFSRNMSHKEKSNAITVIANAALAAYRKEEK